MKILIHVHRLSGGGAERVALSWAEGLASIGNEVTLLTDTQFGKTSYRPSPKVKLMKKKKYHGNRSSLYGRLRGAVADRYEAFMQFYKLFKRKEIDAVINVLYLNSKEILLARLLSGSKIPLIETDHNAYERPKHSRFSIKQWTDKFILNRLANCVTVLTHRDKEILTRRGINHVEQLDNPLFLQPVEYVPVKKPIVLAVGRLDAYHCKGFDILIKAWCKISGRFPEWKLRIVGSGSANTKKWLKSLTTDSNDSIEIIDFTTEIESLYREASIFVLSSRYEGWGLVLVEAMSQGCAAIACDYKGRQTEIVEDGVNGLICPPEDIETLAKKIELLISDKALREQFQQAAPSSVKKFDEIKVARRLEKLITSTLEK